MNNYNWDNKEHRAQVAQKHRDMMEKQYSVEIDWSAKHTTLYDKKIDVNQIVIGNKHKVIIANTDSVSALFDYCDTKSNDKIALLNFASFKNAGGAFLNGSRAQEECLCHESILYNVLSRFNDSYYKDNLKYLNRSLYKNRALYSKDILFIHNNQHKKCDVITLAAPNFRAASKYRNVPQYENESVLKSRIKYIFEMASVNYVDCLILGAYGCGVFGQDPKVVARTFKEQIMECNKISTFIFPVPISKRDRNFSEFRNEFISLKKCDNIELEIYS